MTTISERQRRNYFWFFVLCSMLFTYRAISLFYYLRERAGGVPEAYPNQYHTQMVSQVSGMLMGIALPLPVLGIVLAGRRRAQISVMVVCTVLLAAILWLDYTRWPF